MTPAVSFLLLVLALDNAMQQYPVVNPALPDDWGDSDDSVGDDDPDWE